MKKTFGIFLLLLSLASCAPNYGARTSGPREQTDDSFSSMDNSSPFPSSNQDDGPQVVIPATGGDPVIGIPTGGGTFIPVTGGDPVIGVPVN